MTYDEARALVHDAIGAMLDEGEIAVQWVLTIDVAGPDGTRYLAHRSGGGADGAVSPTQWAALGMLSASVVTCEEQLRQTTINREPEDDE